jgi:hypothetical protein
MVEERLSELFAFFVGAVDGNSFDAAEPAIRAYGSVVSFGGRADMIAAAAEAYFHARPTTPLSAEVKKMLDGPCRGFASRRNEIAHGRVVTRMESGKPDSCHLYPGLFASKKYKVSGEPVYLYTADQINEFGDRFGGLYETISDYLDRVLSWHSTLR